MTLKELSQLYHLNREIELDQQRLAELRTKASSPSSPKFDGLPGGGFSRESRMSRYTDEIADLEAIISAKTIQSIHERNRLERYITTIPDSHTRQIFTLRFVEGLSWDAVAIRMGGSNSWKNLSNICYRYIEKSNREI